MSQDERAARIFNLVDAINQCSYVFRDAEGSQDLKFRKKAHHIRRKLETYGFELITELQRLGFDQPGPLSPAPDAAPLELQDRRCLQALESTVERFKAVLAAPLTAHARAMIRRQHFDVEESYKELMTLDCPACP